MSVHVVILQLEEISFIRIRWNKGDYEAYKTCKGTCQSVLGPHLAFSLPSHRLLHMRSPSHPYG